MNRALWTLALSRDSCPAWPCPSCGNGAVSLLPDSLVHHETAESVLARNKGDWEPEWIEYGFAAWGRCTHKPCSQHFAIAGTGGVGPEFDDCGEWHWEDYFQPLFCTPMPQIISVPERCPKQVADALGQSFSLYWLSPGACAGAMRISLECLLDHVGVSRVGKDKKGEPIELTLHRRIELYAGIENTIGAYLMALKWLGNTGSHTGEVGRREVLDAFEILEHVLAEVVGKRSARVAALTEELTKKHGR